MSKAMAGSPNFVSKEEALANTLVEGAKFMLSETNDFSKSSKAVLAPKMLEIYDINGTLLFYDISIQSAKNQIGTIRAVANKIMGNPVISIRLGVQKWNIETAQERINEILKKKYARYKVTDTKLVCYSYPKLGLQISLNNEKQNITIIFDIADYTIIPEKPRAENIEGVFAWSFLDSLSKREQAARLKKYDKTVELVKKIFATKKGTQIFKSRDLYAVSEIAVLVLRIRNEKKLQFCTHYTHTEAGSHHCFILHAQQVNDYCSVATCQMILCYYRYYYSQNDIAPSLGYSPGSGCPADVSAGYETLSNNHLNATFDTSATWNEARDQIKLLQPMKSGIPGHARAIAGYSNNIFSILGSSSTDKKLYVYDPWPWNADLKAGGDIYWEDWDSITHTNFVYTKLDY